MYVHGSCGNDQSDMLLECVPFLSARLSAILLFFDAHPMSLTSGSAMIEIMYDIAPGATYKFNTGFLGEQVRFS